MSIPIYCPINHNGLIANEDASSNSGSSVDAVDDDETLATEWKIGGSQSDGW